MFLEKHLQNLGLTEKEAKVYLATLELGADSILNIAKKANIKRPTTYVIIEELKKRGLVSEKPLDKGTVYIAEDPEKFRFALREKEQALGQALPFLRAMYNVEKGKPQVRVYEGIEGMKQVYLETVWKSKTDILFFSSISKIYEAIPDLLDLWLADAQGQRAFHRHTKEFINPDPADIAYGLKSIKTNPATEVRVIPKNAPVFFIGTDNAIFEDKIMLVSFEHKLFTTVIQSQVLTNTLRALYLLAWEAGIPIQEFVKHS